VAAYDGFPGRYPHWRFGMEYLRMSKSFAYGLHRIYEMVVNNNPSYAYLLASNKTVDQKTVMAHVYAHVDFFKNNLWFAHTNRKMMDEMANHGTHIRRYIDRYGYETVEKFLDVCLSLDNLIDPHSPGIRRRVEPAPKLTQDKEDEPSVPPVKLPSKFYMDDYINPPEFLEAQRNKIQEEQEHQKHFPERPERDALLFLLEHAPLEEWQSDIISIVREEAYYFAPQGQTKIMNEGWASYWHSKIMTQRALVPDELIDYADHHAGSWLRRPVTLIPISWAWNCGATLRSGGTRAALGRNGKNARMRPHAGTGIGQLGLGRQKIFEVRRVYNDVGFIDAFLTTRSSPRRHNFFTYKYNPRRMNM